MTGAGELRAHRLEKVQSVARRLALRADVPVESILGDVRDRHVVAVRHQLWVLLYDDGMSTTVIGDLVGRDHTTILAAVKKYRRTRSLGGQAR